ncbi:hypothetical protein HN51_030487 [Arachis hypogaea]|uniref:transcription factor bHLH112 n=1 Tax=Arachis hypogaea TaxID=3818 RepID=UPI000DED071A|nr:transcription factor bHLH112 [Arachis hypogaea]
MAEEFQATICGDNYWWNSNKSLFSLMGGSMTCSVAAANDSANNYDSFWQGSDFMDFKGATTKSSFKGEDTNKCSNNESSTSASVVAGGTVGSIFINSTSQMMSDGFSSSPSFTWNNPSLFGCNERSENNFQSVVIQEETGLDPSNNNSQQIQQQQEFSNSMGSGFTIESSLSASYDYPLMQAGLFGSTDSSSSLFTTNQPTLPELSPIWSTVSSFMKPSSFMEPKQLNGLQFSNNTPFCNASTEETLYSIRSDIFSSSSSQPQLYQTPPTTFDNSKPNNALTSTPLNKLKREESPEKASSSVCSKNVSGRVFKKTRIETPSPLPTFKVRKEKLGDRITALQQLVSPFGKTDTASVLHEAIEYIKFLHDQVNVLTAPYMKNGSSIQDQQGCDYEKDSKCLTQDLNSRGLCLVPVASTFPMATETTADFWTPTFGNSLVGNVAVAGSHQ